MARKNYRFSQRAVEETLDSKPPHERLFIASALKEICIRDQDFDTAIHFRTRLRDAARELFPQHYWAAVLEEPKVQPPKSRRVKV